MRSESSGLTILLERCHGGTRWVRGCGAQGHNHPTLRGRVVVADQPGVPPLRRVDTRLIVDEGLLN